MKPESGHQNGQASIQEGEVGITSPSSFWGLTRPAWIGAEKMFPDLTRDDVFRLETRRLWLRWPRHADGQAVVHLAGNKAVAEMTALIPHPYPADGATTFIFESRKANALGHALRLAITPNKKPNQLVGMVGIEAPSASELQPSLGYWLGQPYWGRGYMTEAVRALADAWFAYMTGRELVASARTDNPASRRVLEKCGFAHAGSSLKAYPARGAALPVDYFRLDRRAWERLTPWSDTGLVPQDAPRRAREMAVS
jgi:RimJ/RimL family protein N-acetyltransferase